jgi:O-antigen ligase
MTTIAGLLVAWGALAFGAVYPWAYWPLFGLAALTGIAGLSMDARRPAAVTRLLVSSAVVLFAAVALQLVPLPRDVVAAVSPQTDRLLRDLDIRYAAGVMTVHPLSIDPAATAVRLAEFTAFTLFTMGLARVLTARRAQMLAHAIIGLGAVVALIGIVQKSTGTDRIYGFWVPFDRPYQIFGPFVNRNHFAGWMIMPLAVGIGVLCGRLTTAMSNVRRDWRSRVLWWSSRDASQLLLVGGAIVVMAFAIVLTHSRSGNACLGIVVALGVLAAIVRTRASGQRSRGVTTALVVGLLAATAITWAGTQPLLARLQNESAFAGRLDAWRAAVRIASDFPLAGTGLNTFATAMLFYQTPPLIPHWEFAHNDYMQLAAEGGWLIVVPAVTCVALALSIAMRRLKTSQAGLVLWVRIGAVLGLVGVVVQETVDFSLQLPGIALLFSTLIALALFTVDPA